MIRFGLRLTLTGGREAVTRLILIAAAVTVGVGLLLTVLVGINAVNAQIGRYAWSNVDPVAASDQSSRLWWFDRWDYVHGDEIERVDLAPLTPDAPVPPGIARLPRPGEYYASPALRTLLAQLPPEQLGDRIPGHVVGTIGRDALQSPDSLLLIVGRTPQDLAKISDARRVAGFGTTAPDIAKAGFDLVLGVVAAGLLFPVLIFIGTATRLSAARREQRFAAMRLVGATPRQISVISAVESTVAAALGTVLGFGLFFLLRPSVAQIPFTGSRFFYQDLSLTPLDAILVAVGVPICAAIAARLALRRVRISPLGVTRQVTSRPPGAWRLIPIGLGLAELAYFIFTPRPDSSSAQTAVYLAGFLLIMTGLVLAGPWLTMVGARLLAQRSSRPATLIAARRLSDNPHAGFRAVSGLVIALFVTSAATGIISTIVDNRGTHHYDARAATTLVQNFGYGGEEKIVTVPAGLATDLAAISGVQNVIVLRIAPESLTPFGTPNSLISCAGLARVPAAGSCAPGATVARVWSADLDGVGDSPGRSPVWPAAPVSLAQLERLPIGEITVSTNGDPTTIERARTRLEAAYPESRVPPHLGSDGIGDLTKALNGWRRLADVVILVSLPIAGCGLAVSIAGGLSERRRPFSLLRLTGAPLQMLRRVVTLESAVPLLTVAVVAIGAGLLAAHLFLRAQLQYNLHAPGTEYYVIVVVGIAASLGIIASTLPFLGRITGPEMARND